MRISFKTSGGDEYVAAIDVIINHISDFTPAWNQITTELEKYEAKTFQSKGSVDGFPEWQPRKREYPWPILNKTGLMKGALTQSNGEGAIREIHPKFMVFGLDVFDIPYAVFHQYGAPRNNLPQRPVLQVSKQLAVKVIKILQKYISGYGIVRGGGPIA